MKVSQSIFGTFIDQETHLFTLENNNGMLVKITNYGATVTSIIVPNSKGELENIACGFDTLEGYFGEEYKANSPYFGGTIGRYCSQIKDAKFSLNGKEYQLTANCGDNNLHGGAVGFDKKIWNAEIIEGNESSVKMTLTSKDLEEGYPGNVEVSVQFTLTANNELKIDYNATPDQDTPLALTNHTYFNLNAFSSTVEDHIVQVNTSKRQAMDETGAGTGEIVNIEGEADDLRKEISESADYEIINGNRMEVLNNINESSVFSANIETIQNDLEDGDSLGFSDSIIVDGDQIVITFLDPACWVEDYEYGGQLSIPKGDKSELWKKGIEEGIFFLFQIKDNDVGYSEDAYSILGLE